MKIVVLAMLITVAAGETAPLPATGAKLLTRPQILNIIRNIYSVNLGGALGKPSNAVEVASLVNARFNELIDSAALVTALRRNEFKRRRLPISEYTQQTYQKAIEQLYEEEVLTPQLLEGLMLGPGGTDNRYGMGMMP